MTIDNATTNSSALQIFQIEFSLVSEEALVLDGEMMHLRYIAHIINLIVKDRMTDTDESVNAICNAVVCV